MQVEKWSKELIFELLEEVLDPEVPVLSVVDLGIVRDARLKSGLWEVVITPTYSGCPATLAIEKAIKEKLYDCGLSDFELKTELSPAWTTDWISEKGRQKLEEYGIAPPQTKSPNKAQLFAKEKSIRCPLCKSPDTEMISQFGSTACKALYRCKSCLEPFDYFKCI
jgi:ring-1,2-phenylacetyl-CoA epoxidase subunit PaaD